MPKYAIINARLIDGTGRAPQDGHALLTDGATIQQVKPTNSLRLPKDATVIDATGQVVMPGLIDPHTHVAYHISDYALNLREMTESVELNTIKAATNAKTILQSGCTAIGDGGSRGYIGVAVRDAITLGIIPGPKMVACGQILCGSGGIVDHSYATGYHEDPAYFGTVVNGPHEVRVAVRKQMRQGVDMIKVSASGLPGDPMIGGKLQDLSYEELKAAADEAAKFGKTVHAHSHDVNGSIAAARAGIISLHSGEFMNEEALQVLKETGCVFVPTISWLHYRVSEEYARAYNRSARLTDKQIQWFIDEVREAYEACKEAILLAHKIGAPIAVGSDGAHVFPPFTVAKEMEYFQDLGIKPITILHEATQVAAKAIGKQDVWGTLEPGKSADILIIKGDPSKDVRILQNKDNIQLIMKDGEVVKDTRTKMKTKM
jgi:imidazolonepropionase-like amidohydrolase